MTADIVDTGAEPTTHNLRSKISFAPFSEARPYRVLVPDDSVPAIHQGFGSDGLDQPTGASPTLNSAQIYSMGQASPRSPRFAAVAPPCTPQTARVIASKKAAMNQGCEMQAVAFAKSVHSLASPRVVVVSPRRPMPRAGASRIIASLPSVAHASTTSSHAGRAEQNSISASPTGNDAALSLPLDATEPTEQLDLRELSLFNSDRAWLFYPPVSQRAGRTISSISDNDAKLSAASTDVGVAAVDFRQRQQRCLKSRTFRRGSTLVPGALIDFDASSVEEGSAEDMQKQHLARHQKVRAAETSQQRERTEADSSSASLMHHSANPSSLQEDLERCLSSVPWFRNLPRDELKALMTRANHRTVPRWSTIMREGAVGTIFYVLLKGSVQITSSSGLNLTLPAGVSFGEGALITSVRREATVVAIEPCHLVQLTAGACDGLTVPISDLRTHMVAQMLCKVHAILLSLPPHLFVLHSIAVHVAMIHVDTFRIVRRCARSQTWSGPAVNLLPNYSRSSTIPATLSYSRRVTWAIASTW